MFELMTISIYEYILEEETYLIFKVLGGRVSWYDKLIYVVLLLVIIIE